MYAENLKYSSPDLCDTGNCWYGEYYQWTDQTDDDGDHQTAVEESVCLFYKHQNGFLFMKRNIKKLIICHGFLNA